MAVTISKPSADEAKLHPRAYAIYVQLISTTNGAPIQQHAIADLIGQEVAASLEGNFSFAEFAKKVQPSTAISAGDCNCVGIATHDSSGKLSTWTFNRRSVRPNDVRIQITHCGICHSDLHQIKNEWGNSSFPMVPGHEIVGIVTEVGPEVTRYAVGDRVGVGCMVNSCRSCEACESQFEQFCPSGAYTYNGKELDGTPTYGGYSTEVVVTEHFVMKLPSNLPLDASAPLLCAGITVYAPIVTHGLNKPGMKVGVAGLGGLGHMAVKILKAFGCTVVVLSTSPKKKEEAIKVLGADEFLIVKDEEAMQKAAKSLHGIIDTISADHDIRQYISLLKFTGKLILLGVPPTDYKVAAFQLLFGNITVAGSLIGGMQQTQEMLDFCGKHNITCEIEKIDADYVNTAMERLAKNDVHYRFVIDVQKSLVKA